MGNYHHLMELEVTSIWLFSLLAISLAFRDKGCLEHLILFPLRERQGQIPRWNRPLDLSFSLSISSTQKVYKYWLKHVLMTTLNVYVYMIVAMHAWLHDSSHACMTVLHHIASWWFGLIAVHRIWSLNQVKLTNWYNRPLITYQTQPQDVVSMFYHWKRCTSQSRAVSYVDYHWTHISATMYIIKYNII